MTPEQFEHWLDFARRMARDCHRRNKRVEALVHDFIEDKRRWMAHIHGWDGDTCEGCSHALGGQGPRPIYICDELSTFLWDYGLERERKRDGETYRTPTGTAVACCVRAAIDVAIKPSAGVVGYTAGDLRRMYPDGFPPWLADAFESKFLADLRTVPDTTSVWL
jgi:hypothetical protein